MQNSTIKLLIERNSEAYKTCCAALEKITNEMHEINTSNTFKFIMSGKRFSMLNKRSKYYFSCFDRLNLESKQLLEILNANISSISKF